ncbi:MAG: chorismate mutase [Candidatus Odinarchaeia archaeon]
MQAGLIERVFYTDAEDITTLRKSIDKITLEILRLFKDRIEVSKHIGRLKLKMGREILDLGREQKLERMSLRFAERLGLPKTTALKLIKLLIEESKNEQKNLTGNK